MGCLFSNLNFKTQMSEMNPFHFTLIPDNIHFSLLREAWRLSRSLDNQNMVNTHLTPPNLCNSTWGIYSSQRFSGIDICQYSRGFWASKHTSAVSKLCVEEEQRRVMCMAATTNTFLGWKEIAWMNFGSSMQAMSDSSALCCRTLF